MLLMIVPGVISLMSGILLLCAPQRLLSLKPASGRSWVATDPFFMKHRISAGLCLMAVAVFCLSSAYYVWLRLHS